MTDIARRKLPGRTRQWIIGLISLLLLLILLWWFWPSADQAKAPGRWGDTGAAIPVRVQPAMKENFTLQLKALGTVTAYNTVNVRSRVEGELVKVLFEEGQQVKAGDLLAVIDPRPFEVALQQAEGALLENQAQLKNAQIDLQRYRGLYAEDSIAKQTLDTQEALVNQYQGSIKRYQADVANAKLNLQFTQITAPISGRLGLRQVDIGNLISGGDSNPLVVITATDPISVVFTLPEGDLPSVLRQVNQGKRLVVEAWDRGERTKLAVGELESLDNQIDTATGTVKLKARFDNAEGMLFPNQFVNVRLQVETLENALVIPSAAVQFGNSGTFVFSLDDEDKIRILNIVVAAGDGERTLVGSGVEAGQRLVIEGTDRLREGSSVTVVDDSDPEAKLDSGSQVQLREDQ